MKHVKCECGRLVKFEPVEDASMIAKKKLVTQLAKRISKKGFRSPSPEAAKVAKREGLIHVDGNLFADKKRNLVLIAYSKKDNWYGVGRKAWLLIQNDGRSAVMLASGRRTALIRNRHFKRMIPNLSLTKTGSHYHLNGSLEDFAMF